MFIDRRLRLREQIARQWLPWLLAAGILLICVAFPLGLSSDELMLLTAVIAALVAVILFLRWPPFGLLALLFTALLLPSPYLPGGLNIPVLVLLALVMLWIVDMVILRQELRFVHSRPLRPLLAFNGIVLLSFVIGQLPWFSNVLHAPLSAQIGGLLIFLLSTGAFLLAAHQLHDLRWLRWLTWIFIVVGWLHVAGWFIPYAGIVTSRLIQFGVIDNSIYWTWLVALALSQALFNRDISFFWRIVFGFIAVSTLYVGFVLNGEWKSGYLPAMAAAGAIVAARSWRLGLFMVVIGLAPAAYLVSDAIASDTYSYSTRVDALVIMAQMATVSPILGFGPANYYWYTPLYKIRGWEVQFNSHNQYADIIAQVGLSGDGLFSLVYCRVGLAGLESAN